MQDEYNRLTASSPVSPTISTTLWTAILDPATLQGALAMLVQDNREFLAAGSASQGS